jgi:putative endonuclease
MKRYWVYILTNRSRTLYVGVTGNLERRLQEHRRKEVPGFTARYRLDVLVWSEEFQRVEEAIACEKQIKGWRRSKKVALIEKFNPGWHDLSGG